MTRRNNKGFTMIEILAAITIMGILLMLVVPGVSKLMKGFREDYYEELEETVTTSAKEFYTDNKIYRPDGLLKSSHTSIDALINKKYLDKLTDYKGKSCSLQESYVIVVYRGSGNYEYRACIKCQNDAFESEVEGTYCDPAWLTNDNIKYDFDAKKNLYIYHNTPKEAVREKLLNNINIVKYNKNGEVLDKVALAEGKKENILPTDIDKIDTSVIDPNTNMKETTLHYNIENENKELKVVIYKHKEPKVEMKDGKGNTYAPGTWTNKLVIKLSKNDDFFELSNTSIANFQMSIDDGEWKNINCAMTTKDTCSITIQENVNAKYKFRIVTNEGKFSDETQEYEFKVDATKPTVTISPNGAEPIVNVGSTTGTIEFNLTTNDKGGSNIKSRKYAITLSSTTEPSSFTNFNSDEFSVSKKFAGNKYYVWARVEDNAGNVSTGVWPSEAFHMKYEIIYDANGGTGAPSKTYKKHGTNLTLSSTKPSRTGYKFAGWSTTSNGDVSYSAGDTYKVDKAIRLYAVWTPNVLTINYYSNYATSSFEGALHTVGASENVLVRTTIHYYDEDNYDGLWNYSTSGSSTYLGRTGYTATGYWGTSTSGGNLVDEDTSFANGQALAQALGKDLSSGNATVNVYAQWRANILKVIYSANGGTSSSTADYKIGTEYEWYYDQGAQDPINFSSFGLTRTGYSRKDGGEWNTKADGSGTSFDQDVEYNLTDYSDAIKDGDKTITLYAQWTISSYTVTYNANGGSVSPTSKSANYNTSVTLPTPTRSGYTFNGWYTASSGGTKIGNAGASYTVTGNITLYAQWIENVLTVNYYNGNTKIRGVEYYYATNYPDGLWAYSTLGISKTGYTGTNKWETSGGTYVVDQSTSFSSGQALAKALGKDLSSGNASVNVYAIWTINSYKVTYNANGGSVSPTSKSANYNTSVTLPTPTRSGYTFNGWYTASSGGTKIGNAGASYTVTGNITLYAQWSHTCISGARSNSRVAVSRSRIIGWGYTNNHWCSASGTDTCLPNSNSTIYMYYVTCKYCGAQIKSSQGYDVFWCPVHANGGNDDGIRICDKSAGVYTGCL